MSQDRRIHSRLKTRAPARLLRAGDVVEGVIENIGEGGVFFATEILELPVDDGAEVTVEFRASRGGPAETVQLAGTVLRTERYFDGTAVVRAFAIRFDDPIDVTTLTLA
jgi:hypothetical protein